MHSSIQHQTESLYKRIIQAKSCSIGIEGIAEVVSEYVFIRMHDSPSQKYKRSGIKKSKGQFITAYDALCTQLQISEDKLAHPYLLTNNPNSWNKYDLGFAAVKLMQDEFGDDVPRRLILDKKVL